MLWEPFRGSEIMSKLTEDPKNRSEATYNLTTIAFKEAKVLEETMLDRYF